MNKKSNKRIIIFVAIFMFLSIIAIWGFQYYDKQGNLTTESLVSQNKDNKLTQEDAQKIYSVMLEYGLAQQNIAGVIGNLVLDASTEPVYDEDWQDVDKLLLDMLTPPSEGGNDRQPWISTWVPSASPEDAALEFAENWGYDVEVVKDECQQQARSWFVSMQDWDADTDYANSIVNVVRNTQK